MYISLITVNVICVVGHITLDKN